jgi:hypothetical protein
MSSKMLLAISIVSGFSYFLLFADALLAREATERLLVNFLLNPFYFYFGSFLHNINSYYFLSLSLSSVCEIIDSINSLFCF